MLVIAGSRGHGIRLLPLGFLLLDLLLDRLTLAIFLLLLLVPLLGQFLLLLGLLLHFELLLQLKLPLSFFVPFLFFKQSVANLFGQVEIDSVVFDKASQSLSAIVDLAKLDEQRDQVIQLAVLGVIIPWNDGHGALRLQHVGRGRIVQDDGVLHVSSNLTHILGKDSVDICAVLSEQTHGAIPIGIHQVHERICILAETCGEDHQLEVLTHGLQKVVNPWPFGYKDITNVSFDVHWNSVIRIFYLVELRMHEGFI
jgi:hypothetical protein